MAPEPITGEFWCTPRPRHMPRHARLPRRLRAVHALGRVLIAAGTALTLAGV